MADEESPLDAAIGRMLREDEERTTSAARHGEDCIDLQQLSVASTSGDTMVIVRFPQGDYVDCGGRKWDSKEFLMDSKQLLATGSSVFKELLSPKVQTQTRRHLSDDYRPYTYVLDLTPQMEGDGSASEVAELSLSQGVIDWWRFHYVSQVSKILVSGHDDNCPYHFDEALMEDSLAEKVQKMPEPKDIGQLEPSRLRKILDYCPIRHRVAILRLLMAIRTGDLYLNSAPRLVTMAIVAKQFDCVRVVKDHALIWFMAEPNNNFIDINAEDAFKIAWILELSDVARVAFQVLVTERALDSLNDKGAGINNKQPLTIFGRPRGSVTEEQETCIQHAAQKLRQRAEDEWARLMANDLNEYLGITQWPRVSPGLCQRLREFMRKVVRDAYIFKGGSQDPIMENHDRNRARFVPAAELVPTEEIYETFIPAQRILTRYFWQTFNNIANTRWIPEASNLFERLEFCEEFATGVRKLREKWDTPMLEVNIEKTGPLVFGLSDDDFKFLPLWAGGLDDGTGAVYQTDIPDAESGVPIGPGPGFYTGETIPDVDDYSSSDDSNTIYTGTETVTMTQGFSVGATRSHTVCPSTRGLDAVPGQAVLPAAQRPGQARFDIDRDFDWMSDGLENTCLSDLDDSDTEPASDDEDDDDHATYDIQDSETSHSHGDNHPSST
ncbi:hypothetical protein F5Y01DRAFT_71498 [Xylaria sp. FL0043]|nr:hypothetical protein F5Y01DRAFT_71498 [Xylaria sp. FL0043]